jgi:hypothetical protein
MIATHLRRIVLSGLLMIAFMAEVGCGQKEQAESKSGPHVERSDKSSNGNEKGLKTDSSNSGKKGDTAAIPPDKIDVANTAPVASLDAQAYFEEYEKDQKAAIKKYQNKVVEIKGVVKSFDLKPGGSSTPEGETEINLQIKSGTWSGIGCKTREKEPWSRVLPGQTIKIKGVSLLGIMMENCVITETDPTPPMTITAEALAKEAQTERAAAKKKYEHKWVILEGEVIERKEQPSGVRLVLKGEGQINVNANFTDKARAKQVEKVKVGDKIKLATRVFDLVGTIGLDGSLLITQAK